MNTKNIATGLLIILILAACTPSVSASRAENFAFVYNYTPCGSTPMYVLDTISGTLVYTPLGEATSITISLQLTNDELESIYQKAVSVGFFEYPSKFVVPTDQSLGRHTPAASFELKMTNDTATNSVSWTDDALTDSGYTKADHLRELMYLIDKIIQSHPEVQELPEGMLCL